jgi:hypothetical protein
VIAGVVVVLATVVSYPLGLAIGSKWLLPVLNALPAYLALARLLARERRTAAVGVMLAWAGAMAVCGTVSLARWPASPDALVLHGPQYRDEMFAWIRTGQGAEGDPARFLPQHLAHLGAFVVLSLVTASALSILMGAVLMNYMAFYVASLARAGLPFWAVLLFGWQPWAVCRVAAFSILGVVLAEPLLARVRGRGGSASAGKRWVLVAAGLLVADVVLKWVLAPAWGASLRSVWP